MCTPPRLLSTTPPSHLSLHNYLYCTKYYRKAPKYYSTKAPDYYTTIYAAPTYDTEATAYYTTKAVEHSDTQVRWKSVQWAFPPPNKAAPKFRINFVSNSGTANSEGELFIIVILWNMYLWHVFLSSLFFEQDEFYCNPFKIAAALQSYVDNASLNLTLLVGKPNFMMAVPSPTTSALLPQVNILCSTKFVFKR
jgi:hypothetical protein